MQRRRLVRVPASSANLGPGFDALAAALSLHLELEVVETGTFAVETDLAVARDARNLVVRGSPRSPRPRTSPSGSARRSRSAAGWGRARPRTWRAAGRRPPLRARRGRPGAGHRARGPPRQRRGRAAGRVRRVHRREGHALRRARGAGGRPRRAPRARADARRRALRCPTRCRSATPSSRPRTPRCSCSASAGATGSSSRAACATACTSPAAGTSTRARWRSWTRRTSSGRSGRPCRARARRCSCGANGPDLGGRRRAAARDGGLGRRPARPVRAAGRRRARAVGAGRRPG